MTAIRSGKFYRVAGNPAEIGILGDEISFCVVITAQNLVMPHPGDDVIDITESWPFFHNDRKTGCDELL